MDRRRFLQTMGVAGAGAIASGEIQASSGEPGKDPFGVLVDTTYCVGCRNCELMCAETNGLPIPKELEDLDDAVFAVERKQTPDRWSIVNRYETDVGEVFVKKQCMHCVQPACASACLTKAMYKTEDGPIIWRESKCMGCRFCMVSCPFDIPKFEYDSAVPKIQKCILCFDRLQEGGKPACVENCPAEALTFGRRSELIREARTRIYGNPDSYVDHIYGEREVGGTGWLYLSAVPFEQLGFRTGLGTESYPELTTGFLYSVPIVLTLWPALLLGMSNATKRDEANEETEGRHE